MAFDRKEFGMNSGIPFIKIADRVEVDCRLEGQTGSVALHWYLRNKWDNYGRCRAGA